MSDHQNLGTTAPRDSQDGSPTPPRPTKQSGEFSLPGATRWPKPAPAGATPGYAWQAELFTTK